MTLRKVTSSKPRFDLVLSLWPLSFNHSINLIAVASQFTGVFVPSICLALQELGICSNLVGVQREVGCRDTC
jgi:hypothetical protein